MGMQSPCTVPGLIELENSRTNVPLRQRRSERGRTGDFAKCPASFEVYRQLPTPGLVSAVSHRQATEIGSQSPEVMQSCNISVDAKSRTVAVPPQSFDRHRVAGARRRSAESPTAPPYPLSPAIAPVGNDRKLARLTVEGRFCQRCLAKNRGSTGAAPAGFDTLIWPPNDHLNWPPEDKAI
jgi:hypothetical protein